MLLYCLPAKWIGAELVTNDFDDFRGIDDQIIIRKIEDFKK